MRKKTDEPVSAVSYIKTVVPIALALVVFLVSAGFILFRIHSARLYNERWKDYDECGV